MGDLCSQSLLAQLRLWVGGVVRVRPWLACRATRAPRAAPHDRKGGHRVSVRASGAASVRGWRRVCLTQQ
jgi:hypothetical protein